MSSLWSSSTPSKRGGKDSNPGLRGTTAEPFIFRHMTSPIEILAPAGAWPHLQAAIHAASKKAKVIVFGKPGKSSLYKAHIANYCCFEKTISGKKIPMRMTILPTDKPDERTVVEYQTLELNVPVDQELFTRQGLRREARG